MNKNNNQLGKLGCFSVFYIINSVFNGCTSNDYNDTLIAIIFDFNRKESKKESSKISKKETWLKTSQNITIAQRSFPSLSVQEFKVALGLFKH